MAPLSVTERFALRDPHSPKSSRSAAQGELNWTVGRKETDVFYAALVHRSIAPGEGVLPFMGSIGMCSSKGDCFF